MATINKINVGGVDYDIGGGSNKAQLIERVYYTEGVIDGSDGFLLTSQLQCNQFYLINYYNDEWGTKTFYFGYVNKYNTFIGSSDNFMTDNTYDSAHCVRLIYNFVDYSQIAYIIVDCYSSEFVQNYDSDYIEIIKIPMELVGGIYE